VIKLAILGSTGSIGQQALEVINQFPEKFELVALAAGQNIELLAEQVRQYRPKYVAVGDEKRYSDLVESVKGLDVQVMAGLSGLIEIATITEVELLLTAVVGAVGIEPTLAAIRSKKRVALANKETLVAAGSIVIPEAKKHGVAIIPVDSEHSAIFQCLEGREPSQVNKIILTASGGPFLRFKVEKLENVTVAQALKHPNWNMGGKITIDSATMFNKGLEIIEAHWLFDMEYDKIDVVIHPESIVHSLVELVDGSLIAQLGLCDMKLPIQLGLTYPERWSSSFPKLDLTKAKQLNFLEVDTNLFPAISLAYKAGRTGGCLPAIFNAANEAVVAEFLRGKIKFTQISSIVAEVMGYSLKENFSKVPSLEEILRADQWARKAALQLLAQNC